MEVGRGGLTSQCRARSRQSAPSSDGRVFCEQATTLGLTTSFGPPLQITRRSKGTSGAAALVAGVAALVISANNDLTAAQVCDVLERAASKDLDLEGGTRPPGPSQAWEMAPIPPFQRGDFDHDGWSPWFGFGRVDAFCAVVAAMNIRCF